MLFGQYTAQVILYLENFDYKKIRVDSKILAG